MDHAFVFDCEFLTAEGAPQRFWCGPHDPDPVVVQIGLVAIGLAPDFPLLQTARLHIIPRDRQGHRCALDPLFTRLTGIDEDRLDCEVMTLAQALDKMQALVAGRRLWSWGKDEFNLMAISCYVAGLAPPIPAPQFGNACQLLLQAGMPYEDIKKTRSNQLAAYFQLDAPPLRGHDALDDALSVAYVLQHLLRQDRLPPSALR